MYRHLKDFIMFPLLPFLPTATVPRIVIIWRSNQSSQAAFQAAGTEGADRVGVKEGLLSVYSSRSRPSQAAANIL